MSWGRPMVATATCAVALATASATLAGIVVASSGPSAGQFPAGKKVDASQSITLKAGDSVTILDERGTRVLRGAGTFKLDQMVGQNRSSTFAALTHQRGSQRVRTGAVRRPGTNEKPMSPNLWFVDLSQSGTHCVVAGNPVSVWRADAAKAASYRVTSASGATSTLSFDADSMVAAWDGENAPVTDGASYTVSTQSGEQVARLAFVELPSQPAGPEDTAAALIAKGCSGQLELLSASLATSG